MYRRGLLLVTTAFLLFTYCHGLENLDTLQPIVKISPARKAQTTEDRFGFSATVHKFEEILPGDTLEEALQKITIVVGAPYGKFPGGISGLEYGYLACAESLDTTDMNVLMATTQEERAACLNYTTGLVYQCRLNETECGAITGNGDARSPDGYLFERSGNDPDIITAAISLDRGEEIKEDQQMGFTVQSYNGFLVACAPMWKHIQETTNDGPQPRGRCVYSGRSLSDFVRLLPCQRGRGLNQNFGSYCTTGIRTGFKNGTDGTVDFMLGTPGRFFSRGGVVYYSNASDMTVTDNGYRDYTTPPSIGGGDVIGRRTFRNVPIDGFNVAYYGMAFASGKLLNNEGTQFIVGAPRHNNMTLVGHVYVVNNTNYMTIPTVQLFGEQFSEMFGYSIAVLDLNNDGFDDVIVGAPLYYETTRAELGRLFVYENDQNDGFINSTKIVGLAANSRFGTSIAAMGDLNNDGFEDFAVSAPYEGSGVVYIYYGQERDSTGSIVNLQYAQRIDGSSFVDRVSNISEVNMFGFSLSGGVDIDNNLYNDLLISAFETQTVFMLRSRPFANITSNLTASDVVKLDSYGCELNGLAYSCFNYQFCASFSGKSIADEFTTNFMIWEPDHRNPDEPQRRLQFSSDITSFSTIVPITFTGENNEECVSGTVYIRNGTTSLFPFRFNAQVLNIERPDVVVDTNTVPGDLSALPVISAGLVSAEVRVFAECGPNDICESDLALEHINTTLRSASDEITDDQMTLIVDDVDSIEILATFSNGGEDAFNSFFTFAVPREYVTFDQISIDEIRVSCLETTPDNVTHDNRRCSIRTPFSMSDGAVPFLIRLRVGSLVGNEDPISVPISIMIGANSTRNIEEEQLLGNNTINVMIPISARSVFTVSGIYSSSALSYQGNHTPVVDGEAGNLGQPIQLTATFRNQGPTRIRNATFTVYIPSRLPDITGDYYFVYPARLSIPTTDVSILCTSNGINPDGLNVRSKRKRFIRHRRALERHVRQEQEEYNLNCFETPNDCINVTCSVSNLGRTTVDVNILGYIDERFFFRKQDTYRLQGFANGTILDDFYNTDGSQNNDTFRLTLAIQPTSGSSSTLPEWYVIAVPIFGALIFLLILAVALYFFGFFKRKGKDSGTTGDDEFDQFDSNPFGGSRAPAPVDPELKKYEAKGREEAM